MTTTTTPTATSLSEAAAIAGAQRSPGGISCAA